MDETLATRPSLLVRIRDPRDEPAWQEFAEIYGPLIVRLGLAKGLQEADAADLAQEVFSSVARSAETGGYDPARGSFRGWLFGIARNKAWTSSRPAAGNPGDRRHRRSGPPRRNTGTVASGFGPFRGGVSPPPL